jgi:hypothetical protein
MFWFFAGLSAIGVLESVICSNVMANFAGHWLRGLLTDNEGQPHGMPPAAVRSTPASASRELIDGRGASSSLGNRIFSTWPWSTSREPERLGDGAVT